MGAKEVLSFLRMLRCFAGVNRYPAIPFEVKLRPAMIARNISLSSGVGQGESDGETGRDAYGAAKSYKNRVKIGAIPMLCITGIEDIAASPPLPAFIVFHRRLCVIINSSGFLKIGLFPF